MPQFLRLVRFAAFATHGSLLYNFKVASVATEPQTIEFMPELTWIGKDKVVNHHHDVPFRILEKQYTFGDEGSGNKIIHGDNLAALKSLLPEYEDRIKCIYIDPPYNTGNEGWVYNDNVNDPKLKKWLHQVVGKEGEDLSRHDKWLCMMYPRLKLLRRLLSDDGVIFVSIDDNEQAHLRLVMNEVFGSSNFVANVIWRSSDNSNNDAKQFSLDNNHTVVFAKKSNWLSNRLDRTDDQKAHYSNPDNDPRGAWFDGNPISSPNPRANLTYPIVSQMGFEIQPPRNGWRWSKETLEEKMETGEIRFTDDGTNIRRRTYLADQKGLPPSTLWIDLDQTGHNRQAKYELQKIFFERTKNEVFATPKPVKFIQRVLDVAMDKDSLILDSFAGSGTTAHAVLKLNAADGGNRKFILIEQEDYAETITAERVRRVMNGYGESTKAVAGLGGGFDYYVTGEPLFLEDGNLNEEIVVDEIRKYVAYTENLTAENQLPIDNKHSPYLLGKQDDTAYIFYYEKMRATTLDLDYLSKLNFRPANMVFYADICLLNKNQLQKYGIIFKKIPRDITRF